MVLTGPLLFEEVKSMLRTTLTGDMDLIDAMMQEE